MEMGELGGEKPFLGFYIWKSSSVTSEYSGPGSIQMENTYIPCLLDGWGAVVSNTEQNEGPSSSFGCLAFWQRCPVRCCMFPGDGRLKGFLNAMPNICDFVNLSSQIGDRGISCPGPWWDQLQSPLGHSQGRQNG